MQQYSTAVILTLLVYVTYVTPSQAADFLIAESTDFTGNGCQNADVNDITSSLEDALEADGWTGKRWVNSTTYPDDFTESCDDNLYGNGNDDSSNFGADRKDLAVYAGHGNSNLLQWGFKHNGRCTVSFKGCGNPATCNVQRLGSMNGNDAGNAIYGTSCTLKQDRLTQGANRQWLWQQFGYHNSPVIGYDGLAFFYEMVRFNQYPYYYADNNTDAWLITMEAAPGSAPDNSPMVVSYGQSESQMFDVRDNANLSTGQYAVTDRPGGPSCGQGPPGYYWWWVMIDNGTSSACN